MKATRTATSALRSARVTHSLPKQTIRASSSEAGPSTPSSKSTRRLPKPVLRKLVDLHHHSSTFLHDPSTFPSGFQTAFNALHTPELKTYSEFQASARSLHARRSFGGLDNLRPTNPKGVGAIVHKTDRMPQEPRFSRSAWTGDESWIEGRSSLLSEREVLVNEALYGSWMRGTKRDKMEGAEVGLEGVEEYMTARKSTAEKDSAEWKGRHDTL